MKEIHSVGSVYFYNFGNVTFYYYIVIDREAIHCAIDNLELEVVVTSIVGPLAK